MQRPAPAARATRLSGRAPLAFGGMVLTFVADELFADLLALARHGPGDLSILAQVLGLTPSGDRTGSSTLGAGVGSTVAICAAIALYDGLGAPGAASVAARLDTVAPQWLQYGVCALRSRRAVDRGRRTLRLRTVLSGIGAMTGRIRAQ